MSEACTTSAEAGRRKKIAIGFVVDREVGFRIVGMLRKKILSGQIRSVIGVSGGKQDLEPSTALFYIFPQGKVPDTCVCLCLSLSLSNLDQWKRKISRDACA